MANLQFPSNPVDGQQVTVGNKVFIYNVSKQRWIAQRNVVGGRLPLVVDNSPPTLELSVDSLSFDTAGQVKDIVYNYSDPDGGVVFFDSISNSGIANTSVANVEHFAANNTVRITVGSEAFTGSITVGVSDGRSTATATANVAGSFTLNYTQQQKLESVSPESFGISVAIDGDTAVISGHLNDDITTNAGTVYVYTRSSGVWSLQQKIYASDAQASDAFGNAVAISGDTIIVGAKEEDTGGTATGSAYIFTRSGTTWTQQALLRATGTSDGDYFGWSVAIEGDIAVVGSPRDDQPVSNAGAVYIYTRSGSTWTQRAKINRSSIPGNTTNFQFGQSVSISGNTIVVGAQDNPNQLGIQYVYVTDDNGLTWTEQASFRADDGATGDQLINSRIYGDTIVAGAERADPDGADSAGAVYIFTRSGTTWTQQQKLTASDAEAGDRFGISIDIDGDVIIVGAGYKDTDEADVGAAYIFRRSGTTWTQQAKIQGSDIDVDDRFGGTSSFGGFGVSISGDTVIVGASGKSAAYVFTTG